MTIRSTILCNVLFSIVCGTYLACVPGRYGRNCDGVCECAKDCSCRDGVDGDGTCNCDTYDIFEIGDDHQIRLATNATPLISELIWTNSFIKSLDGDPDLANNVRQVYSAFYSFVKPTPLPNPYLIHANVDLANDIRIQASELYTDTFLQALAGNTIMPGSRPVAQCYGGHQFGHWSGQLGDGRAILLGEIQGKNEIQLKGAGKTPYSRHGDGRAVLRSSVREYLCSEAMYRLNISTSRALSIIGSDYTVFRDQFYNGNGKQEKTAVVARVAPSWIRFGTFEIFYYRNEYDMVIKLADYVIAQHFENLQNTNNKYTLFFREVVRRTAETVAKWMSVGFAHGVLNTDNMSILGLTIDFGPFGFLDIYDPNFIPNTSDDEGRYMFKKQPEICLWNLEKLGVALSNIIPEEDRKEELNKYWELYEIYYTQEMRRKLGLTTQESGDYELVLDLLLLMADAKVDYTLCFRNLYNVNYEKFQSMFGNYYLDFQAWCLRYLVRISHESNMVDRINFMKSVNPSIVPRNHLLQLAISYAEEKDFSGIEKLFQVFKNPYLDSDYDETPIKQVKVSCSS